MADGDKSEIDAVAERAAQRAIEGFFLRLGIDTSTPESVISVQKDFAHLRNWRKSVEMVRSRGLATAVAVVVTGILAAAWGLLSHKF